MESTENKDDWYRSPAGQHKDRRSELFTGNCEEYSFLLLE